LFLFRDDLDHQTQLLKKLVLPSALLLRLFCADRMPTRKSLQVLQFSPWKALSDDNRREILLLLGKKDSMIPTEIAEHFKSTLPTVSIQLRILKEANLITDNKQGKNRFYSLNKKKTLKLLEFFEDMYDYNLNSLKEYVENKKTKRE
jgi:ArsR family transcriptional regulator, arsenate/arsenite/antimonite-responsive transcriptional repressor